MEIIRRKTSAALTRVATVSFMHRNLWYTLLSFLLAVHSFLLFTSFCCSFQFESVYRMFSNILARNRTKWTDIVWARIFCVILRNYDSANVNCFKHLIEFAMKPTEIALTTNCSQLDCFNLWLDICLSFRWEFLNWSILRVIRWKISCNGKVNNIDNMRWKAKSCV